MPENSEVQEAYRKVVETPKGTDEYDQAVDRWRELSRKHLQQKGNPSDERRPDKVDDWIKKRRR